MSLRKKAIQSIILASSMVVMTSIAVTADTVITAETIVANQQTETTDLATGRTAGVVLSLNELEEQTMEELQQVGVTELQTDMVTASRMVAMAAEPALSAEEQLWQNRLMADVDQRMNVRAAANAESEIVGYLRNTDAAEIIGAEGEWTHIRSGNVEGYVKNEFCVFGLDALAYARENVETKATVAVDGLRIRSEASEESSVIAAVANGTVLVADTNAEVPAGWTAVRYEGTTRYVSAEYVTTELAVGNAITVAEEQEEIRRRAEEEARRQAEEEKRKAAQRTEVTVVQNAAMNASVDDTTLLAALIQCEAGGESHEGKVAVGAVVMNRVRSGHYPNSISGVIYAPGQFTPAGNGKLARVLESGPNSGCMQAAQEAINGVDNTGGATSFRQTRSGRAGLVIGGHVFF